MDESKEGGVVARAAKVLIVDDELSLAENVAEVLSLAGHEAAVATSAEEALAHLTADLDVAEILLTDYRLPGATGADLIAALRGLGSRIPALIITAYHDERMAQSAIDAGADDILGKPVDVARLLSWIEAALQTL